MGSAERIAGLFSYPARVFFWHRAHIWEVFRQELEYGGHGAWAGSVKSVRHVTAQKDPLGRFKRRAEKALVEFISEYEASAWA